METMNKEKYALLRVIIINNPNNENKLCLS